MRTGDRGAPRRRPSYGPLLTAILVFGLSAGRSPALGAEGVDGQPPLAGEDGDTLVPCPRCDEKGKATCDRCKGEGQLFRTCRRCQGTGRRPCSQCTKEDEATEVTTSPGEIPCTYCGGKGFLGSRTQKTCPQCGGTQVNICPSCRGKGSFECPKLRPAGICPDCGMTGKVTCPLCKGSHLVSASVLRRESGTSEDSEEGDSHPADAPGSPKNGLSKGPETTGSEPTALDLDERFLALEESYRRHHELFSQGVPPELETAKKGVAESLRRMRSRAARDNPLITQLTETQRRIAHLETRWAQIYYVFNQFQRSFLNCKTAWDKERSSGSGPARTVRQLFEPLKLRIQICERFGGQLDGEKPTWLLRESEAIHQSWTVLSTQVEEELKRIAEEERKKAEENPKEEASPAHGGLEQVSEGTAVPSPEAMLATGEARPQEEPTSPTDAGPAAALDVRSRESPPPSASPANSGAGAPDGSSPGTWILDGVLWVGSVFITAGLLVLGGYWLRKQAAGTPGSP